MQFFAYWAALSFVIYTGMPYKSPQLSLHILLPVIMLAGAFFGRVLEFLSGRYKTAGGARRIFFAVIIASLIAGTGYYYSQVPDKELHMYLTAPPPYGIYENYEGYEELSRYVDSITGQNFERTVILIVPAPEDEQLSDAYWPLPWHMRKYDFGYLAVPPDPNRIVKAAEIYNRPVFILPEWSVLHLHHPLQGAGYEKREFGSTALTVYRPENA